MSAAGERHDRLGAGLGQPLGPDAGGRLRLAAGPEKVRQAIFTLLDTEPGERVMRPDFGCGLSRYLMAPNNPATHAAMERDIRRALERWEPRIEVREVTVTAGADAATALIEIRYAHVLDGRQDILVFPFYLEQTS